MTTTLITGANRGIGLALAIAAADAGHTVLGTARDPASASALRDAGATILPLDVADPDSIDALARALAGRPIDILVNNAAIYPDKSPLEQTDLDAFDRCMRTNVRGPLAVTRALLPNLHAGKRKTVAHISSSMGSIAQMNRGGSYAYKVSKTAVNMIAKSMAAELPGFTVLAIDPGWVRTDMGGDKADLTPEHSARGVLAVIERSTPDQSGAFLRYDGAALPW